MLKLNKKYKNFKHYLTVVSGFFIIPILSFFISQNYNLQSSNFTGLIYNLKNPIIILWFSLTLSTVYFLLKDYFIKNPTSTTNLKPFLYCAILSAISPYTTKVTIYSILHVVLAYVAFFYLHYLFFFSFFNKNFKTNKIDLFYFFIIIVSTIIVLKTLAITFLAQVTYLSGLSIYLTLYYIKK